MSKWVGLIMLVGSSVWATVPTPIITTKATLGGYTTLAGRLTAKAEGSVGIAVKSGLLVYTTVTDADGKWAVVIRQQGAAVFVQSFDLRSNERSGEVEITVESSHR